MEIKFHSTKVEKCLRNGLEKSNGGTWDFHMAAEKAMQFRTWQEA
jgi:hypothetical protein